MPQYEDLVVRAPAAQERAHSLTLDAARVARLGRILCEAHAGGKLLLHYAWCGRLDCFARVTDEAEARRGGTG